MRVLKVLSIIVFFSLNFSFLDIFLFLKKFCNIKYGFLLWEVRRKICLCYLNKYYQLL